MIFGDLWGGMSYMAGNMVNILPPNKVVLFQALSHLGMHIHF
jgi:hypothetical protein